MQIVLKKKLDYDTPRTLSLNNINPLSNGFILGKMIIVLSFLWCIQLPFGVPPTPFSISPSLASVHCSLMITGYPRREEDELSYLWHQSAHPSFCYPSQGISIWKRGCWGLSGWWCWHFYFRPLGDILGFLKLFSYPLNQKLFSYSVFAFS